MPGKKPSKLSARGEEDKDDIWQWTPNAKKVTTTLAPLGATISMGLFLILFSFMANFFTNKYQQPDCVNSCYRTGMEIRRRMKELEVIMISKNGEIAALESDKRFKEKQILDFETRFKDLKRKYYYKFQQLNVKKESSKKDPEVQQNSKDLQDMVEKLSAETHGKSTEIILLQQKLTRAEQKGIILEAKVEESKEELESLKRDYQKLVEENQELKAEEKQDEEEDEKEVTQSSSDEETEDLESLVKKYKSQCKKMAKDLEISDLLKQEALKQIWKLKFEIEESKQSSSRW